jgi:hypothetical protein
VSTLNPDLIATLHWYAANSDFQIMLGPPQRDLLNGADDPRGHGVRWKRYVGD